MSSLLTIGEFSRRTQLSLKALRLYDRLGLLTPAVVDPNSRYRRYDERQLYTARLIAMLRQLDMPLATVAEVLAADEKGADVLAAYWNDVEQKVSGQRKLGELLRSSLADGTGRFGGFRILERDVPEQQVVTELREVVISELDSFIRGALARLDGAVAGVFVIFHGPVDTDRSGPVEVCVPTGQGPTGQGPTGQGPTGQGPTGQGPTGQGPATQEPGTQGPAAQSRATRCEPGHHEAFVRLTKSQWGFPQILSAYDAVEQWVHSYSLEWAGSPREVYLCDPGEAGPDDEVCDVAIPLTLPQGQAGSLSA